MHKLKELAINEIRKIEDQGLTTSNFQIASELVDMVKDLCEIEDKAGFEEYDKYRGNYGRTDRYNDYGRSGGKYMTYQNKGHDFGEDKYFEYMMEDIEDGVATYHEGRGRMRYGNADPKTIDGLEKLMHGVASLVDAIIDMADTQEEKDIVKKHMQKIKSV